MENNKWKKWEISWLTIQLVILLSISIYSALNADILWVGIISIFATLTGAIGTFLATKKINYNFLFGIFHVFLYSIVAFESTVYGDFALNLLFFLPMDILGWIYWNKKHNYKKCECKSIEECDCKKTRVKKLSWKGWILSSIILALSITIGSFILSWFGDKAAILDSGSTMFSIFGMILMTFYFREQWLVWFIVNILSVGIWIQVLISTGDQVAWVWIAMWSIYLINSSIGIKNWIK